MLGVLEGEVMRVLLLFYLAPLWTVPIARLVLGERLDARGFVVMALAFAGAMTMLWRPELGFPWPASRAEWLGLARGLPLRARQRARAPRRHDVGDAGEVDRDLGGRDARGAGAPAAERMRRRARCGSPWRRLARSSAGIGVALVAMSLALQYGLSRLPANRAIVILLFELVVAAIAAYYLAGEVLRPQDWIGGALIASASSGEWPGWNGARRQSV